MDLHFYAQKKFVKNGTPQTPQNYPYATRAEAERQFYLLCAAAILGQIMVLLDGQVLL